MDKSSWYQIGTITRWVMLACAAFLVVISFRSHRVSGLMQRPALIKTYGWPITAYFVDEPGRNGIIIVSSVVPASESPIRGEWQDKFSLGYFRDWLIPDMGILLLIVFLSGAGCEYAVRNFRRISSTNKGRV